MDYKLKKEELQRKLKEKEEFRQKSKQETYEASKQVLKQKPVFVAIEEKFKEEVEIPELEEKKKKLKERSIILNL